MMFNMTFENDARLSVSHKFAGWHARLSTRR